MKKFFTSLALILFSLPLLVGQNTITVQADSNWVGFMNVFNLSGGFEFGSPWAIPDIKSTLDLNANTVILQPNFNTYANTPDDPFWVNQTTGEGAKVMEALTFLEPGDSFQGTDLTFSGAVQSYTLDTAYEVKYFIKALDRDGDFADVLGGAFILDLPESGPFSVTVPGNQLVGNVLIQCGFSVTGRNANPANEAELGSVTIGSGVVSVNNLNELQIDASIFPNPVSELLSIKSDAPVQSYQVTTLLGQLLLNGPATNQVDVSGLAAGSYLITVRTEEGQKTMKFFKR